MNASRPCDWLDAISMQSSHHVESATPFLSNFHGSNTFAPTRNQQTGTFTQYSLHYYDQWKPITLGVSYPQPENSFGMRTERHPRSAVRTKLRHTLEQMLFALINGRDYAGAARVLSLMYHLFKSYPEICVQMSLEVLRRSYIQTQGNQDLKGLYRMALKTKQLDKILLQKELFLFYISQGELYDAYHLYKSETQIYVEKHKHDSDSTSFQGHPELLGNFGVLCYWLLLIESPQLREKLSAPKNDISVKREPKALPSASDSAVFKLETEAQPRSFFSNLSSFESWIDQSYKYTCSIGAHILFQEARMALRHVLSVLPDSAAYLEYYVQLLTIIGEISTAADYLEDFYHRHPSDVHAIRMLVLFLRFHYLDSTHSAQVHLFKSWLKADPTSFVALRNLHGIIGDTASGRMPTWWAEVLASVLDTCGSDLYFQKNSMHAVWIWRMFAEHFAALTHVVPEARSVTHIRESRDWWKRVFFSSFDPTRRYKTEEWCEWILYKAAVAQIMFGCESSVHFPGKVCKWVRTELESSGNVFSKRLLALIVRLGFNKEYTEGEVVREHSPWGTRCHSHKNDLKVCTGSLLTRQDVIPTEAITSASETNHSNKQQSPCLKKRKLKEISSDSLIVNGITPLPAYVAIIEELVYQKRDLYNPSISHIKTLTKRRIKHLANSHSLVNGTEDMAHPLLRVPTVHDIRLARSYFRSRLLQSMLASKKSILPVRCEQYINIWLLGNYTSFSQLDLNEEGVLQEQILKMQDEMRRCVPRPQTTMLFTNEFSVTSVRRKMLALRRLRRRILHSFATVTRQLALKQYECGRVWLIRHIFNAAWTICIEKRQTNLISQQALKNTITSSLCSTYLQIVHPYRIQYRSILFEFHRPERGYNPPGQRKRKFLVMEDAPKLLAIAKDRCSQLKPTLALIQAFIWIHLYFQTFPQLASIHLLPPAPETRNRSGGKTPGKNRPRKR